MTRYTSVGQKRTHLEAGFGSESVEHRDEQLLSSENKADGNKKRKRRRKTATETAVAVDSTQEPSNTLELARGDSGWPTAQERGERRLKEKSKQQSNESRRQKRIDARLADTTCYACRSIGHSAKDCPSGAANKVCCYRCGSTKHTLSNCRKRPPENGSLPFASCFVCKEQGHLTGSCPKNGGKGVYPKGGACKLCNETSHLAKDCPLRRRDALPASVLVGTGLNAGADEDDFHVVGRARGELDEADKQETRLEKLGLTAAPVKQKKRMVSF